MRLYDTKHGEEGRLSITDLLVILDFIVAGIQAILFTKDGKFKSLLQLIWTIPTIISFLKKVIDMINGRQKPQPFKPEPKAAVKKAIKDAAQGR